MARIRTIKPKFYDDLKVGRLSRDARYLYIALWVFADDLGVDALFPDHLHKSGGVAAALAGQDALVHALVAEHDLGIGVGEDVVDLDGDDTTVFWLL